MATHRSLPDGLEDPHLRPGARWHRHASPLSLVILGAIVLLGVSGALGHERDWRAEAGGVHLDIHAPEIIRNGEFLEMRIRVEGDRGIGALTIGIGESLWEDLTVNTFLPAATAEESRDGELRFSFGGLEAGEAFLLKVDLQVNPDIVLGNQGTVTVYDGEDPIVSTDLTLTVLP